MIFALTVLQGWCENIIMKLGAARLGLIHLLLDARDVPGVFRGGLWIWGRAGMAASFGTLPRAPQEVLALPAPCVPSR